MYPIEIRHEPTEIAEQQAYNTIYAKQGIDQRDSFYLWFLDQVVRYGRGRLLDVSCGEGSFIRFARRAGFATIGIDFSAVALQKAQRRVPSTVLALANAQQLPFADNSFDVVTNIGSLEHYFDPAQGVREMARVLRPSGVALVLLPNAFGLFGNITHVLRHGEVYDDGQPLQRYATRASWERLLQYNGLIPDRVIGYEREAPRTLDDLRWLLRRPSKIARLLLSRFVPVNLGNMLIFVCHKA
jgi:SAM-dependent methyltransferase